MTVLARKELRSLAGQLRGETKGSVTETLANYSAGMIDSIGFPILSTKPLRVMLIGDSMTNRAEPRSTLVSAIYAAYGVVQFVGPNYTFSGSPSDYSLPDGHAAGYDGAKAEDFIDGGSHAIRQSIIDNQPDIVMIQLGTNNIGSGQTCDTAIANITSLVSMIRSLGVSKILLSTIPPYLADATKDRQRILYNAKLWSLAEIGGVHVYHGGGTLVAGDLGEDLIHPTVSDGYTKLGNAWFRAFENVFKSFAPDSRSLVPRAFATHAAQSCCVFDGTTDYIQMATNANNALISNTSFVIALWHRTGDFSAEWGQLFQYGTPTAPGVLISYSNLGSVTVSINGVSTISQAGMITEDNAWYRFVLVYDAVNGTLESFVNGRTRGSVAATLSSIPTAVQWVLGWGRGAGLSAARGTTCDFTICLPSVAGFRIPNRQDIYNDYYECTPGNPTLPGVSAYWPMHEGSGASVADYMGGSAGTLSSVAWASVAMPGDAA